MRILCGVHLVLGEGWGHHAEDEVEADGAEGCEAADVAEPEFARLPCLSWSSDCRSSNIYSPAIRTSQTGRRTETDPPDPRRP